MIILLQQVLFMTPCVTKKKGVMSIYLFISITIIFLCILFLYFKNGLLVNNIANTLMNIICFNMAIT